MQIPELERAEAIFRDYAYFASYSDSWLAHCERFCGAAVERFRLGPASRVVEAASNDGYLLQFFARAGIPVLGIEPARNVAAAAEARGIPTRREFFGETSARRLAASRRADASPKNSRRVGMPFASAAAATFSAGSTPRTGIPSRAKNWSR